MPVWLLKLILEFAVRYLVGRIGHMATVQHFITALAKATPLKPETNPPLSVENNPNAKNHFGGL